MEKKLKREFKVQASKHMHGVSASEWSPRFALCDGCGADFSMAHDGLKDIHRHIANSKHQDSCSNRFDEFIATYDLFK